MEESESPPPQSQPQQPPQPPIWEPPLALTRRRRGQRSSAILHSSVLIIILPTLSLFFIFFILLPSLAKITTSLPKPNIAPTNPQPPKGISVKKGWDSINIVLVVFAILCGLFARRNAAVPRSESHGKSGSRRESGVQQQQQQQERSKSEETGGVSSEGAGEWYGYSHQRIYSPTSDNNNAAGETLVTETGISRLRRTVSEVPTAEVTGWETGNHRLQYFDDFNLNVNDHVNVNAPQFGLTGFQPPMTAGHVCSCPHHLHPQHQPQPHYHPVPTPLPQIPYGVVLPQVPLPPYGVVQAPLPPYDVVQHQIPPYGVVQPQIPETPYDVVRSQSIYGVIQPPPLYAVVEHQSQNDAVKVKQREEFNEAESQQENDAVEGQAENDVVHPDPENNPTDEDDEDEESVVDFEEQNDVAEFKTHNEVVEGKENEMTEEKDDFALEGKSKPPSPTLSPPTPPPSSPPPSPPPLHTFHDLPPSAEPSHETETIESEEKKKKRRSRKKININPTKEIVIAIASLYSHRKRKRKQQKQQQQLAEDEIVNENENEYNINNNNDNNDTNIPAEEEEVGGHSSAPFVPPPPPPPPPAFSFQGLFRKSVSKSKSKKIHSIEKVQASGKPPLPRSGREAPFFDEEERDEDAVSIAGSEASYIPPPPPFPPPFKVSEMRFTRMRAGCDQVQSVQGSRYESPEREREMDGGDEGREEKIMDGQDEEREEGKVATSLKNRVRSEVTCPSPDVNAKADSFIARHHDGWRLEKINSWREKGVRKRSNVGPTTTGGGPSRLSN